MTQEEFEAAVAGCGMPCWINLRSGEQLPCSNLIRVAAEFVVFDTHVAERLVRLADIDSVGADEQKGPRRKGAKR
jgi:hypothetical protein